MKAWIVFTGEFDSYGNPRTTTYLKETDMACYKNKSDYRIFEVELPIEAPKIVPVAVTEVKVR